MLSFLQFSNCNFKTLNGFNRIMLNLYNIPKAIRVTNVLDNNSILVDQENKNNILSRNKLHDDKTTNDNFNIPLNVIDGKWKSIQRLKNFSVRKITDLEKVDRANRSSQSLKTLDEGPIFKSGAGKIHRSAFDCRPSCARSFHTTSRACAKRPAPQPEGSLEDRRELHEGLFADSAYTSCKYLYDSFGSKLFEVMCELPDYYLTRTEASIFDQHAGDIAASVGPGTTLIDLGAGNCAKAARLMPVLRPRQYVPVDISADFLEEAARGLRSEFPDLDVQAVTSDFSSELRLPLSVCADKRLFFYPGSSIGSFTPPESLRLIREMRALLDNSGAGLLFGFDMVKDVALLDAAYNDELGILNAFHLNLLPNVNRLLGADFDILDWRQKSVYNLDTQCVDIVIEAKRNVVVTWPLCDNNDDERMARRSFRLGEQIHTTYSHKFTEDGVRALLHQAGFAPANVWFDSHKWFMVCHARPV